MYEASDIESSYLQISKFYITLGRLPFDFIQQYKSFW